MVTTLIYYINSVFYPQLEEEKGGGWEDHGLQKTKPNLEKDITQGTEGIFSQFLHIIAQLDWTIN